MPSLLDLLSYNVITGTIKEQTDGLPKVLPESFYKSNTGVIGDQGYYVKFPGTRDLPIRTEYGSPSVRMPHKKIADVPVKLLHTATHITFSPATMMNLRAFDSNERQDLGRQEVNRQHMVQSTRLNNFRTVVITQAFAKGAIYFNDDGTILPTSSGAEFTVNFGVPANNQNQLNGIIGASWATITTDIPGDIRAIRKRAAQLTGYPLKYAFYGENIPGYLTANTLVQQYLSRNTTRNDAFLASAELPEGLFGLTWIPVYEAFYEDAAGAVQEFFGADTVVFTPEAGPEWWDIIEGTYPVPTTIDVVGSGMAALESVKEVRGLGGYGLPDADPVTFKLIYFDTFLPIIKVPSAIFIADTTP